MRLLSGSRMRPAGTPGARSALRPLAFFLALEWGLLFLQSGVSLAGTYSDSFLSEMNKAAANQTLTGLVALSEQLDAKALEAEMDALGIHTRWRRHEYVVRAARELAGTTQPAVIAAIGKNRTGRTVSVRSYWIANMLAVEAEAGVFEALTHRGDVEMIYSDSDMQLREGWEEPAGDYPSTSLAKSGRTLQSNLIAINVEGAWEKGYTGAGRLVCSFDTGVHGTHPAYATRWRGHSPDAEWHYAWFDPYTQSEFPFDAGEHGTHTLGIMVAHPPGEEPIGVAYEADWIAAGALIGWSVEKILMAYEWALDPDGNPSTIRDVPDVISNSWGMSADCDPTFWNAIDLVEAAGIVNTIAVDNSGPGFASVNSPESRAGNPYVNFGVGNLNPHQAGYPIHPASGRGPSPCDSTSIKPELTAPGTQIYSTLPSGYGYRTGTSMACPHVSGTVAILRQVNPSLTVDQIKSVLMNTAVDLGDPGPDNTYGWGLLDVGAAVEMVLELYPPSPSPRNLEAVLLDGGVELSWDPPLNPPHGNPVVEYRLYRALEDGHYPLAPFATVPAGSARHHDAERPAGSHRYLVTAGYTSGAESEPSNEVMIDTPDAASVDSETAAGRGLRMRVHPNPFTSQTEISLRAGDAGADAVSIFDLSGRMVRKLKLERFGPEGRVTWDGHDGTGRPLPAGIYFARPNGGREGRNTARITLVR